MMTKPRRKIYKQLMDVASEECNLLADAAINIGTTDERLIILAYKYVPLKELRRVLKEGIKEIERLNQD
tara:strand:- start:39 stop:245 length:207 start_codon:yes stop_codon:yes gene_type:complete